MRTLLVTGKAGVLFERPRLAVFAEGVQLAKLRLGFTLAREALAECDAPNGCTLCHMMLKEAAAKLAQYAEGQVYGD